MKRLSIVLLAASTLLLLGGCALQPAYRYNGNAGGGYYSGQSPYGDADTVIYGNGYVSPWGWGPRWGTGWLGYGGISLGTTYVYRPRYRHYRHYRRHGDHHRRHRSGRHQRHHARGNNRHHSGSRHHARPPQRHSPSSQRVKQRVRKAKSERAARFRDKPARKPRTR